MSINHISLMGTIVRGPEFRMTPNGVPTAAFSLAVTRPPRTEGGPEVTDYVKVITWRALAERVSESVQKGDLVTVSGRLQARSYETQDGQRRKTVEVDAQEVFPVRTGGVRAESPESGASFDDDFDAEPTPPARAAAAPKRPAPAPAPAADLDDEIPF